MKIDQTSRPAAVQQDFMFLMAQINRQWRRIIDRQLHSRGLTEAMWLPLLHLARASQSAAQPMRQKDLAASLSLDSSSVVRLLDGLENAGFIERAENADRRANTIRLTASGKSTVKKVESLLVKNRREVFACVPEQALEQAFGTLECLAEKLTEIEQGLQP
jgi:MarR family transcriptional regulator for hemolysin